MKPVIKKILFFLLNLFVYFLPTIIFRHDTDFYKSLKGNFVPPIVFMIMWTIIFITLSILNTYYFFNKNNYNKKDLLHYFIVCGINWVFIMLFPLAFFTLNSLFFSYIVTILCTLSCIILVMDSLVLNKKMTLLLTPYLAWSIFASFLSVMLYLKN